MDFPVKSLSLLATLLQSCPLSRVGYFEMGYVAKESQGTLALIVLEGIEQLLAICRLFND